MSISPAQQRPTTDADLFSDELSDAPFETLARLRDQAGAVYVPRHNFWVITRYDDVRAAALDHATFSSAQGVALLDQFNEPMHGSVLASDPPMHTQLREVLADKLAPRSMRTLRDAVLDQVRVIVDELVARRDFDGVKDLAQKVPVKVVGDLVGVPEDGREHLLPGADAVFTTFGPFSPTLEQRMPAFMGYLEWMGSITANRNLEKGSWGDAIFTAVDAGLIPPENAFSLMTAYLVAGLDTTSNGIASMLCLFAQNPDLWDQLKTEPTLAGGIFEETLRLESPVQGFFRNTTTDTLVGDTEVPAGSRVMLHFGAANRDEGHYVDPDEFDVRRNPLDHLAFGYGNHGCAGQGLARLEASCIMTALLERVERIDLTGDPIRHYNPVLRGLESLPLRVTETGA